MKQRNTVEVAPNKRVQRTRSSAWPPHSPLTRYSLGAARVAAAIAAVALLACGSTGSKMAHPGLDCDGELVSPGNYPIKLSWLERQVTFEQAEALLASLGSSPEPGRENPWLEEWAKLQKTRQPGDQVWIYSGCPLPPLATPPPPDGIPTCGDVGYVIIRGCQVIGKVVYQES